MHSRTPTCIYYVYIKKTHNEEDRHVTSCRHQKQANDVELAKDVLSPMDVPLEEALEMLGYVPRG